MFLPWPFLHHDSSEVNGVFPFCHCSAGLFPLLSNAAMSVKPALLGLYETYYLPLGKTLKPGLQGLLTGVLPGLEEGSEYYDRWAEQ